MPLNAFLRIRNEWRRVKKLTWTKGKVSWKKGKVSGTTLEIPATGLPDNGQWIFSAPEEPITLTVALRKDHLGQWQLVATIPNGTMRIGIADDDASWITNNAGYSSGGVTSGKTTVFEPGQPVGLLRVRAYRKNPDGSSSIGDGPAKGVLVWLGEE